MSDRSRRKHLASKGVHPAEMDDWLAIPAECANLMLSAGVGLDTWKKISDAGLGTYEHLNAAIIGREPLSLIKGRAYEQAKRDALVLHA